MDWFSNLERGPRSRFIQFDIEAFYPSISEELLEKSLKYAQSIVSIEKSDIEIIHNARKSLLFNNGESWMKTKSGLFDVTMGAYDGAEVCELVGLYLLSKISQVIPTSKVGLYRDDGLAAFTSTNGPEQDRLRKKLIDCFKKEGLKIVVRANVTNVDFLDSHMCIESGNYRPYSKPNNTIQYTFIKTQIILK